jgi:hypothetical protein
VFDIKKTGKRFNTPKGVNQDHLFEGVIFSLNEGKVLF